MDLAVASQSTKFDSGNSAQVERMGTETLMGFCAEGFYPRSSGGAAALGRYLLQFM